MKPFFLKINPNFFKIKNKKTYFKTIKDLFFYIK